MTDYEPCLRSPDPSERCMLPYKHEGPCRFDGDLKREDVAKEEPMPAESVIERLKRLERRLRDPMFAELVEVSASDISLLLAVAEAAVKSASILDNGFNVLPDYEVGLGLVAAVRALREASHE